jgi:hypothetical protein
LGGFSDAGNTLPPVVESVCQVPNSDGSLNELWLVVRRYVNGATVRYVEYLKPRWVRGTDITDGFFVDCGLTYDGSAVSTISGLNWLRGQSVTILADGKVHPNKTNELAALFALEPNFDPQENYDDEAYAFFWEALGMESEEVDLEAAEALIYLSLLDAVEAPSANDAFWVEVFEDVAPAGIEEFLQLVVEMPREVSDFAYCVSEIRCWASEQVSDEKLIRILADDENGPYSGVGGFYWADSRTPRNTLLMNPATPKEIFHSIWEEEISTPDELDSYLNGNLWRLAVSQYTPIEILEGIIARIEDGRIKEEITVSNLLIGEPQDFASGLANNCALTDELAGRVQALLVKHGLEVEE